MLSKTNLAFAFLFLFFISCDNSSEEENKALEQQLVGEWRNVSMELTMPTFSNRDSTRHFNVREGEWEKKMKIEPIRTFFRANGTYNSEHRNLRDSLIYNPAGRWVILGDTLIMRDTFPEPSLAYRYKVVFKGDRVEFSGTEDLDRDGQADDHYLGVQRRQR